MYQHQRLREIYKEQHLLDIADEILYMMDIPVGLLKGYDAAQVMMPLQTRVNSEDMNHPYAVQTSVGWCIVGNSGLVKPETSGVSTNTRRMMTLKLPKQSHIENEPSSVVFRTTKDANPSAILETLEQDFKETKSDLSGVKAISQDDKLFIKVLTEGLETTEKGNLQWPLPFKARPCLPNNRVPAERRLQSLK